MNKPYFVQSDELTKLLTASQSNVGPVPPSTMQLLSALATTQSQNIGKFILLIQFNTKRKKNQEF